MSNYFRDLLLEKAGDALYNLDDVRWVNDGDDGTSIVVIAVDNKSYRLTITEEEE